MTVSPLSGAIPFRFTEIEGREFDHFSSIGIFWQLNQMTMTPEEWHTVRVGTNISGQPREETT